MPTKDASTRGRVDIKSDGGIYDKDGNEIIDKDGDIASDLVVNTGKKIDVTADVTMIDFKDGDASSIDPSATAESGWINVYIDGTKKYIPYYDAS